MRFRVLLIGLFSVGQLCVCQVTVADDPVPSSEAVAEFPFPEARLEVLPEKFSQHYQALTDEIAIPLITQHPDAIYVTLGNSPTPVQALMDEALPGRTYNLPISFKTNDFLFKITRSAQISETARRELFSHFDKFFPTAQQIGNRPVVLVDFVQTGGSLKLSGKLIKEYLKTRGRAHPLWVFAFGKIPFDSVSLRASGIGVTHSRLSKELAWLFYNHHWKPYSLHGSYYGRMLKPLSQFGSTRYFALRKNVRSLAGNQVEAIRKTAQANAGMTTQIPSRANPLIYFRACVVQAIRSVL